MKKYFGCLGIVVLIGVVINPVAAQPGRTYPASKEDIQKRKAAIEQQFQAAESDSERVRLGMQLAGMMAREDFDSGMEQAEQALDLAKATNEVELIARSYFGCGNICFRNNRTDRALEFLKEGLPSATQLNDPMLLNSMYYLTGQIYEKRGMYEKALEQFMLSLKWLKKTANSPRKELQIGVRYQDLGDVLHQTGNWEGALEYYQQSVDICEGIGKWDIVGGNYHNMGEVWQKLGDQQRADEAYAKAAEYLDRSKKKATSPPQRQLNSN